VLEAGATTVESISSMWDSFTTGASTAAKYVSLLYEIAQLKIEIKTLKGEFGARVFEYMIRKNLKFSSAVSELEDIQRNSIEKVRAFEAQIIEEESPGHSPWFLESKIDKQKAKFGVDVFDYFASNKVDVTIIFKDSELEEIYSASLENINALDLLIRDKEAKLAELA
jgi:hypothetical protein